MADTSLTSFEIATVAAQTRANLILLEGYCTYPANVEEAFETVSSKLGDLIHNHVEEVKR